MVYPVAIGRLDSNTQFYEEVLDLLEQSKKYLSEYEWCKEIKNGWLFVNIGRVACIFLFEIDNSQSPDDNLIWIVAGDFPTMYTDTYSAESTKVVLETYIYFAHEWLDLQQQGKLLNDCFPFEIGTEKGLIELFRIKVAALENKILPHIEDINYQQAFNDASAH
jgi:hypothetical protein